MSFLCCVVIKLNKWGGGGNGNQEWRDERVGEFQHQVKICEIQGFNIMSGLRLRKLLNTRARAKP